jgi:S-formylglutathione hydrolase FrmB
MTFRGFLFVSGTLTVVSAISLFAQTFGEVTGHISDATGAAVPAAKISLANTSTNAIRETLSTDSSNHTFGAALTTAGIHNVYFESPGTAHEWLTWRRRLSDFAPRLFK